MKFLAESLILSFVLFVHPGRADDPHEISRAKCRDEFNFTEDEVKEGAVRPQPQLACYVKCFLQDIDVMSPDGVMSPEILAMVIGQDIREEAEPTLFACFDETKDIDDACETAFKYFECFRQKKPETFAKNTDVFLGSRKIVDTNPVP